MTLNILELLEGGGEKTDYNNKMNLNEKYKNNFQLLLEVKGKWQN